MREIQIGRVYRHFKGDYYLVEAVASSPLSSTAGSTQTADSG